MNVEFPTLGVVILAAGASSRMGKPKMLLPWRETSIIGHVIAQWLNLGAGHVAVVCADGDRAVGDELDRLNFPRADRIVNSAARLGMFSSIVTSAQWTQWHSGLTQWAIVLGDQPHLPEKGLLELIPFAVANQEAICQPSIGGRPRHPVFLPKVIFDRLNNSPAEHLKQFLQPHQPLLQLLPIDDPAFDFDIDRPEDYDLALRLFSNDRIDSPRAEV